jgi:MoaA/NifB/PqqE/SkfB family radical SAM enzyme
MDKGKGPIIDIGAVGARLIASPAATPMIDAATRLLFRDLVRAPFMGVADRWLSAAANGNGKPTHPGSRVERERLLLTRAILDTFDRLAKKGAMSPQFGRVTGRLWARALTVPATSKPAVRDFRARYGCDPPWVIAVSPGRACNIHCPGCYASSDGSSARLHWSVFDRVLTEAKELWGVKVVVITGGEPFAYRSDGVELLDVVQKHRDSLFVIFTNGTMIDDAVAERLGWMGNATVALSVEGMEESTDARRGPGMFDRVLESISHLRAHGAAFGISATVTRDNCLELMSDEFLDYFFFELDAFYGFLFQYMPVGGDYRVELMPTPAQRLEFWRRSWEVIEKKKVFLFDFWNHGTLVHGCVAAGRERGYLHVDWDGKVTPCVFAQYSTGNVHDVFSRGGDLNDIWDSPFFRAVREWQRGYGYGPEVPSREGNWLAPCPVRDHHGAFRGLLDEHHPEPENEPASKALSDDDYYEGLVSYGEELARLSRDVWEGEYL